MPLSLQSLDFAIICDGREMETYDAKQDGPNAIQAYVASEAGKVTVSQVSPGEHKKTNHLDQQFKVELSNKLLDFDLTFILYIDGEHVYKYRLKPGKRGQILGIRKTTSSILPFKFQELQLVGAFPEHSLRRHFYSSYITEDPDVEDAPSVVPEMGTMELRACRCHAGQLGIRRLSNTASSLHQGRVSERSKRAGWHHVR